MPTDEGNSANITRKTSLASMPVPLSTTSAATKRGGTRSPSLPPLLPLPPLRRLLEQKTRLVHRLSSLLLHPPPPLLLLQIRRQGMPTHGLECGGSSDPERGDSVALFFVPVKSAKNPLTRLIRSTRRVRR